MPTIRHSRFALVALPLFGLALLLAAGPVQAADLVTLRGKYGPYMFWKGCVYDYTH